MLAKPHWRAEVPEPAAALSALAAVGIVTRARTAAVAVLGLRVVYGVALVAAPERLARRWLGPSAATRTDAGPAARARRPRGDPAWRRDRRGTGPPSGPAVAGGLDRRRPLDIASTVAGRGGLPGEAPVATVVAAGASAALSAIVAVAVDA